MPEHTNNAAMRNRRLSLFRDRIVLSDGTVIMPGQIDGIMAYERSDSWIDPSYKISLVDGVIYVRRISSIRIDRATGRQDSTGKKVFENDRMIRGTSVGTVSFTDDCGWRLVIIKGELSDDEYSSLPLHVYGPLYTITGMVPWEAGR